MNYEYILYAFLTHFFVYWIFSSFFYFIDLKYLNDNHKNWKKYKDASLISLSNQLFVTIPTLCLLNDNINNAITKSNNDTYFISLIKIFAIANISNILFYFFHYLLHTKTLYKWIHYKHHEFIEPIAVGALYAHPIEHLFANVLAFIFPFIFIGTNFYIVIFLLALGTFVTLIAHCNYDFMGIKNYHTIHHKLFYCNYGFGKYLDILLNTSHANE